MSDHIQRIDEHLWKSDIKAAQSSLKYVNNSRYKDSFKAQIAIINGLPNANELFNAVPMRYYTSGLLYRYLDAKKTTKPTHQDIALFKKVKNYHKHSAKWCRLQSYYAREFIDYKNFANSYKIISLPFAVSDDTIKEQEWLAGWLALSFLHKPDIALTHFKRFIKVARTPISLSRGFYWIARCYDAKGEHKLANKFYSQAAGYSYTFYGQAANIEIKNKKLVFPKKPLVTTKDKKAIESNDIVKATKLLIKYGKSQLAVIYAKAAIENATCPGEIVLIADIIKATNNVYHTVDVAKIASQCNVFIIDYAFPTPYKIPNLPIDSYLTYSIIRHESLFDHFAVGGAEDMGLMQVTKTTACETAKSINIKCDIARLTGDPLYNIKLGTHHFKKLLEDHSGSYILSIAAYNAGNHRIKAWIERFGDPRTAKNMRQVIDWIELIPYAGTRNYVQRVFENIQVYRSILNKNSQLQFKQDLHACKM
jgi:soluble lytic murein transglycosylase